MSTNPIPMSAVRQAELRAASGVSNSTTSPQRRGGAPPSPSRSEPPSPYASYSWVRYFTFVSIFLLFLGVMVWALFGIVIPRLADGGSQTIELEKIFDQYNVTIVIRETIVKEGPEGRQGSPGIQGVQGKLKSLFWYKTDVL